MSNNETDTTPITRIPSTIAAVTQTQTRPSTQSLEEGFNEHIHKHEDPLATYHDLSTMYQSPQRFNPIVAPPTSHIALSPELNNATARRNIEEAL